MKIAVLVSGGVDSSVALQLLKDQGHDVTAFYLKIWLEDELSYLGDCPWQEDLSYVTAVCEQLGVPLEIVSLQEEYKNEVVAHTIAQVKAGRTPNPDILCNQRIKFGLFLDKIDVSFDKVASGHYAQLRPSFVKTSYCAKASSDISEDMQGFLRQAQDERGRAQLCKNNGTVELFQSPDPIKDQTYFLSHLSQEQLQRVLFPIGHLKKEELRELAHEFNLPNKDRKDSQGICFLGKFKFSDFIKHHLGVQPGDLIEHETGNIMGKHNGFWFYTLGQRQGIRLGGGPWFVVAKDTQKNIVYISRNYYAQDKQRDMFTVHGIHWISGQDPLITECDIKLRHGAQKYHCRLTRHDDGSVDVALSEHDQGIAPGQYAVFYNGDVCLGSGVIV